MNLVWLRRDLRLEDNTALHHALATKKQTQLLFIFDTSILNELPNDDARVTFIHGCLEKIHVTLQTYQSSLLVKYGKPEDVFKKLINELPVDHVFYNADYEPYALQRDRLIKELLQSKSISFTGYKDHIIFEPGEVLKPDGLPYTIFTPFKNTWLKRYENNKAKPWPKHTTTYFNKSTYSLPSLKDIGFQKSSINVLPYTLDVVPNYKNTRDFPALEATSNLSPHLRFGTVGIRTLVSKFNPNDEKESTFLNELIWREFFIHILYHFPHVVSKSFKSQYDQIQWRNDEKEFEKWCAGKTGYPLVDAGMRQLNQTGYMHNRVRMVVASFLCKHLLIDWRWGEAYFAEKLLDYELAANNGNWQWAAGTGCDAAPYFRVFNPSEQLRKFDNKMAYIKKWVPEWNSSHYPASIVEHSSASIRALETYKRGIDSIK